MYCFNPQACPGNKKNTFAVLTCSTFFFLVCLGIGCVNGTAAGQEVQLLVESASSSPQHCGVECLFLIGKSKDEIDVGFSEFENEFHIEPDGVQMRELVRIGDAHGMKMSPVKTTLGFLLYYRTPAILLVGGDHYIAYLGLSNGKMLVFDNSYGLLLGDKEWFGIKYQWTGDAILIGEKPPRWLQLASSPWIAAFCLSLTGVLLIASVRRRSSSELVSPDPAQIA